MPLTKMRQLQGSAVTKYIIEGIVNDIMITMNDDTLTQATKDNIQRDNLS